MIGRPWRVGRRLGRTIYERVGPRPSDNDRFVGIMDTEEAAARAVQDHNHALMPPEIRENGSVYSEKRRFRGWKTVQTWGIWCPLCQHSGGPYPDVRSASDAIRAHLRSSDRDAFGNLDREDS